MTGRSHGGSSMMRMLSAIAAITILLGSPAGYAVEAAQANPKSYLDLVADPDKNFVVIMKDGKIYKNTVK